MVLRKIDVVRWDSPVAKQFNIRLLPTVMILDDTGKVLKRGSTVQMLADPTSGGGDDDEGDFGATTIAIGVLALAGLALFVLTKAMGPQKRAS